MKYLLIGIIKIYQMIPLRMHYYCKFYPRCSDYAIMAMKNFGAGKGTFMALKRIVRCNPFNKGGIDLVPAREER